jgi:hypothetical protein
LYVASTKYLLKKREPLFFMALIRWENGKVGRESPLVAPVMDDTSIWCFCSTVETMSESGERGTNWQGIFKIGWNNGAPVKANSLNEIVHTVGKHTLGWTLLHTALDSP